MKSLDDATFVSGQVAEGDLSEAAEANVKVLVNHRIDGEDSTQPSTDEMLALAARYGMRYVEIPVSGAPSAAAALSTLDAMDSLASGERILLYCRSGMRSTAAWAMAQKLRGVDADDIRQRALNAGFDLTGLPL